MHPILSELTIHVAEIDARIDRETRQRASLARQAPNRSSAPGTLSKVAAAVADTVRQWVDPRGYAMAQLRARTPREARADTMAAAPVGQAGPAVAGNQGTPVTMLVPHPCRVAAPASVAGETATAA